KAETEPRTFAGSANGDLGASLSADGKYIIIRNNDGTAQRWDAASGQMQHVFTGHPNDYAGVAFSPDGKQVLTGSDDGTVHLRDTASGQQLRAFNGHTDKV